MKKTCFIALAAILAASACGKKTECTVSIVPQPLLIEQYEGALPLPEGADEYTLPVKVSLNGKLGAEEYVLDTRGKDVKIKGGSEAAVFYARQTLGQLIRQGGEEGIARVLVKDKPEFAYRGASLDCSRHFWTVENVKEFLDVLAAHKLNTLHWHLTDDQGWRFESRKYPKLTEIGAWRNGTLVGHYNNKERKYDDIRYGGFYTQDEMKEIVSYAAERHITVIPEIEMPGHSTAALASYPEFGCTGGPYEVQKRWGVFPDIFCVGKDETVKFLEDILDEVCEVFPSEYIHIGGDEAPRDRWKECPDCQKRMQEEGLESEAQLQSYLVNRMEKYLNAKGRKLIGWDEILEGGISTTATVMSWRGAEGGKKAAALGNDVVMTPNKFYYFDYYQTEGRMQNGEPLSIGGHVNLEKTYSFDPYEDLDESAKTHIKGIQANMWTEYVSEWDGILFRELPRMAGLCEVAWNASGRTDYSCFVERVKNALLPLYEAKGWPYADYAFRNPPVE